MAYLLFGIYTLLAILNRNQVNHLSVTDNEQFILLRIYQTCTSNDTAMSTIANLYREAFLITVISVNFSAPDDLSGHSYSKEDLVFDHENPSTHPSIVNIFQSDLR